MGRTITKVFPGIHVKRVRNKNYWKKHTTIYLGLDWKPDEDTPKTFELTDVCDILPQNFFLLSKNDDEVKVGFFTSNVINGNKVIAEIILQKDGYYRVYVGKTLINLTLLKMSEQYERTRDGVSSVFESVALMKLCKGVSLNQDLVKENVLMEQITTDNRVEKILRSAKCKKVVQITSKGVCLNCRQILWKNGKFLKENNEADVGCSDPKILKGTSVADENNNSCTDLSNTVTLSESDHKDMLEITDSTLKNLPEKMKTFIKSQIQTASTSKHARRWDKSIIRLCLSIYCTSPKVYQNLQKSGYVVLSSARMIQRYKNTIQQEVGINKEVLNWMKNEAENKKLCEEGYEGGLMIDEMSIQQDLQLRRKGSDFELVGFTECLDISNYIQTILKDVKDVTLATHVCQLVFLGNTGFRFPIAHFPTSNITASELFFVFWQTVKMLGLYGFTVKYVSVDGASSNREFMKICLQQRKLQDTMKFPNIYNPLQMIYFIMDYSHVTKKIRNNLSKSGFSPNHKKLLTVKGKYILWSHFYQAHQWDITNNPFKVNYKLTLDHFYLNSQSKMRIHLAEEVLDEEMLHLMVTYQDNLVGEKKREIDSTIELLKNTSVIVKIFRDHRPINEYSDERLVKLRNSCNWFKEWEKDNNGKEKSVLSHQTREDITSLLLGFDELCKDKFSKGNSSIVPCRVNSDVIENIFCQQRGCYNGANANPTYLTYSRTINSIILGESSMSRKSNTGGKEGAALL